ncbi:hypothetical protein VXF94_21285 (plasmid) [Bacillus amyloliquefaciens]|uniref:hypothetical protein n=1 Tax=Bacillus amyloliquefaciens TaxID=1390 RepID=UPI002ED844D9
MVRKGIVFLFMMTVLLITACSSQSSSNVGYWVLEKNRVNEDHDVKEYVSYLQEHKDIRGYKEFTIAEGMQMVVVSLGNSDKEKRLDVAHVKNSNGDIKLTVDVQKNESNKTNEKNPYVMIGLNNKEDHKLSVTDQKGNKFKEVDYK